MRDGRLASREGASEFRRRYKWFALFVAFAFGAIVVRLFQLQLVNGGDYASMAHENIVRRTTLPTTRGVVRDSQGKVLASSRPAYNVTIVPGRVMPSARPLRRGKAVTEEADTWPRIASVLRLNPDEKSRFEARIKAACVDDSVDGPTARKSPCWRTMLVREDLARDIVAELKEHQAELTGADVSQIPVRYYPFKSLSAHALGYVAELDAETLARLRPPGYESMSADEKAKYNPLGYDVGDTLGATGVERAWESYLRGQRGWEKRIVDAHGRYRTGPEADRYLDDPRKQDPIPGRDLRLTVDIELMQMIEKTMRPHAAGAVVVVDVRTGRLLATFSKPDFDPNDLSGGGGKSRVRETFAQLASDPLRPMLDRTISGAFQPGSTFKPFSALAALEDRLIDPKDTQRCDGYLYFGRRIFHCTHVHGRVDMRTALAASCNVYFFHLAETVGLDRIARVAMDFGLGAKTGLGVNPEAQGRIPTRSFYALRYRGQFRVGFTLNTAIGQGDTTVTPLQLALAYAALANGGTVYSPQLVQSVETSDGAIVQNFPPRVRHTVATRRENLNLVTEALWAVVNDPRGTAFPVRDPGLDVAGKTGTAQTGFVAAKTDDAKKAAYYGHDHVWFAAFSPSKSPEIAVIVFVEHGGAGPTVAAPIAMQIIREYGRLAAARGLHAKPPPPLPKATQSNAPAPVPPPPSVIPTVVPPVAGDAGDMGALP
ncbi:penicillin-binding protein 2 [soil metagenome]